MLTLRITLPYLYPSDKVKLPTIKLANSAFYQQFEWSILHRHLLREARWQDFDQVLYAWYEFCKESLLTDCIMQLVGADNILQSVKVSHSEFIDELIETKLLKL